MFGKRLKLLRLDLNLTQYELGEKINLSQKSISSYEKGIRFPNDVILSLIADYFDVSIDYLFGRTDIKNIYKDIK